MSYIDHEDNYQLVHDVILEKNIFPISDIFDLDILWK